MQVVLANTPAERKRLLAALNSFAQAHQLPSAALQAADLALEEHLTNLNSYGYQDARPHRVSVQLTLEDGFLVVEIEDDGRPFNPLEAPAVDTSLPLDQKPIGGLGVHLIRHFMDELEYRRDANKNILRMRKRLRPSPA